MNGDAIEPMALPLLIGIGNRLRGDDGAGAHLAESLAREAPGTLQVLVQHQLTPELAAVIAASSAVLFLDACLHQERPVLEPLDATGTGTGAGRQPLSHQLSAGQLLSLSRQLYGRCPPAWQLLIPAHRLEHGDSLSPDTRAALGEARRLLQRWRAAHA